MNPGSSYPFKKIVLLFLLVFIAGNAGNKLLSQNSKNIDSLMQVFKTDKDTALINTYIAIGDFYLNSDPDTSVYFFRLALKQSEALLNTKKDTYYNSVLKTDKSKALRQIGWNAYQKGNYEEALSLYDQALNGLDKMLEEAIGLAEEPLGKLKRRSTWLRSATHGNIGLVYHKQGNYATAIDHYLMAVKLCEELKDKKLLSVHYGNIGIVYMNQDKYDKALDFYNRSLKLKEELGNKGGIAITLNNIGIVHKDMGHYAEAIAVYNRALAINEGIKSKAGIGFNLANLAIVYGMQKEYDKALEYNFKVIAIKEELGDQNGMSLAQANIGHIYTLLKKYADAETYLLRANALAQKLQSLELLKETHQYLYELYDAQNKPALALEQHKKYIQFKDSIHNEESIKQQTSAELNYEFEKKQAVEHAAQEKKDALAKEEKEKQGIIFSATIVVLVVVSVFLFLLFNRFKLTQKQKKVIEEKERETQKQNEVISNQKNLVEEKHKEITDSINYAERIQRSFLASKEMLDAQFSDYFVFFKPKDIVSGDFYWATTVNSGQVAAGSNENILPTANRRLFCLVTADSTGHGVPGAIMSIVNISCLKEAVVKGIVSPDQILNETRRLVIDNLKNDGSKEGGKDGMDCSFLSFDLNAPFEGGGAGVLYCAAANNPVWIVRGQQCIEIKPDRMPVGKHDKDYAPFNLYKHDLQKGDVIYTLTDGFADQFGGESGKKFKTKQLQDLLLSMSHKPMQSQKQELDDVFDKWKGKLEQVDDVTIIGIRI
jgi:tetratricopeptide (TPR) repeat protein